MNDEERCAEAKRLERIDDAFRRGDLEALRAALDDASAVTNGPMPDTIGPCLVYAIYRSPLLFIRTLLEIGADPNAPVDGGFPPLIAALSCAQRHVPGATPRVDVDEIVRLLLAFKSDPNQRGINDYTPLHMAVAVSDGISVQQLLDAGADPDIRTRIDDCVTPLEMATAAGLTTIAEILARRGQPLRQRLRSGLTLLLDVAGTGELVRRQHVYPIRLRMSLNRGEAVRWQTAWGQVGHSRIDDNGETLVTKLRIDRRSLVSGLFYGIDGMRVGGLRRLEIAPHLAHGEQGVPGMIPANALLIAEIKILERSVSGPTGEH